MKFYIWIMIPLCLFAAFACLQMAPRNHGFFYPLMGIVFFGIAGFAFVSPFLVDR